MVFLTPLVVLAISTLGLAGHIPEHNDHIRLPRARGITLVSPTYGGPHGKTFDDFAMLPDDAQVRAITLRGANRLDSIKITLTSGANFSHGGSGGSPKSILLDVDEYIKSVKVCWGKVNKRTRIFYALVTSTKGQTAEVGEPTKHCDTTTAKDGWGVIGTWGRDGDEIDQIGFYYGPQRKSSK